MIEYKTTYEMASKWGVTQKAIQNLCMKGKIERAVKRGGVWFMPDETPNPLRNTKPNAKPVDFVGTKKKIFENAIELFMLRGFENVSIKDITDAVGLSQSTVYNHFLSKQDILDTIYDFFSEHFLSERPVLDDIEPILQKGSLSDIIRSAWYEFERDYIKLKMLDITKIIYQRQGIDERARELVSSLIIDNGIIFAETVFNRAIEIGRLAPFDVHTLAVLLNSIRLYTLHVTIADPSPESIKRKDEDEQALFRLAAEHLPDLKPPHKDE